MAITLPFGGISLWRSYSAAARTWSDILFEKIDFSYAMYPNHVIEGMDLVAKLRLLQIDSSLQTYFKSQFDINLYPEMLGALLFVFLMASAICLFILRDRKLDTNVIFLAGILLYLASEFFIPAKRPSYYNVMWLAPLSLVIINSASLEVFLRQRRNLMLAAVAVFSYIYWQPLGIPLPELTMMSFLFMSLWRSLQGKTTPGSSVYANSRESHEKSHQKQETGGCSVASRITM
ncbi:MAG: hypothetical protein IBX61_07100 [Thermoleophilia bacterium]|nr:hypothetical protein [Thermoleophilia bacterium]